MTRQAKYTTLLLLAGALIATVMLAGGLDDVQMHGGTSLQPDFEKDPGLVDFVEFDIPQYILFIIAGIVLVILVIALIFIVRSPQDRRRLLTHILIISVLGTILFLTQSQEEEEIPPEETVEAPQEIPSGDVDIPDIELSEEVIEDPPQWMTYALIGGVATALMAVLWLIWRGRPIQELDSELARLAREAEEAVAGLQSGDDIRDVIMRCYFGMTAVLRESHRIEREEAMTPREFEQRLLAAGLPDPHIKRLTRLFESVRYSLHTPGKSEEQEAIDCLSAIAAFSKTS